MCCRDWIVVVVDGVAKEIGGKQMKKSLFLEENFSIHDLDMMHRLYGKCHVVGDAEVIKEFEESKKPLAATRGNSYMNL